MAKQSDVESLKTSVSNGKSLIASAITDKGVSTAATATFQQMANNIGAISSSSLATGELITRRQWVDEQYFTAKNVPENAIYCEAVVYEYSQRRPYYITICIKSGLLFSTDSVGNGALGLIGEDFEMEDNWSIRLIATYPDLMLDGSFGSRTQYASFYA